MKKVTISRTNLGKTEQKQIYQIEKIDTTKLRLLGGSVGTNINHCVLLGIKNCRDFWHRVYGYQIIQNEEQEKLLLEQQRKFDPNLEKYITVKFYERLSDQTTMYIPKRLKIKERPELKNFPLNIMFSTTTLCDDNTQHKETSIYNPDLSTYKQEAKEQKMKYFNSLNIQREFWIEITYDTSKKSWSGIKYYKEETLGIADGPTWDSFFIHLTAMGVGSGVY